jgi:hypothetical protein
MQRGRGKRVMRATRKWDDEGLVQHHTVVWLKYNAIYILYGFILITIGAYSDRYGYGIWYPW